MEDLIGTLWIDSNAVTITASENTPTHDKFCNEKGYGPAACMRCQLIEQVRQDERNKHGIM